MRLKGLDKCRYSEPWFSAKMGIKSLLIGWEWQFQEIICRELRVSAGTWHWTAVVRVERMSRSRLLDQRLLCIQTILNFLKKQRCEMPIFVSSQITVIEISTSMYAASIWILPSVSEVECVTHAPGINWSRHWTRSAFQCIMGIQQKDGHYIVHYQVLPLAHILLNDTTLQNFIRGGSCSEIRGISPMRHKETGLASIQGKKKASQRVRD